MGSVRCSIRPLRVVHVAGGAEDRCYWAIHWMRALHSNCPTERDLPSRPIAFSKIPALAPCGCLLKTARGSFLV